MKKTMFLLSLTLLTVFSSFNYAKAEESSDDYDTFGYGILVGGGISASNRGKKLSDMLPSNSSKKITSTLNFALRVGPFIDVNFFKYLGIRLGLIYSMLPEGANMKEDAPSAGLPDLRSKSSNRNQTMTSVSHTISLPIHLKIYWFGVENGFSSNLGIEPMYRLSVVNSMYDNTKNKEIKDNRSDEQKKEDNDKENNKFLINTIGGLEYQFGFGLIISTSAGVSLNGLLSQKSIDEHTEGNKKMENPNIAYLTLNLGYNFAKLFN